MTTYILGAGPTGMAVADGLVDSKKEETFVVIEAGSSLGGLARTVQWQNIGAHDLGPHKIFSLDHSLVQRVENLLTPADWLHIILLFMLCVFITLILFSRYTLCKYAIC